ncbi:hypothetical protein BCR42DRAFT_144643 [Absidia repens]|uniref:Uncharacterized protein n=1 Tax=Absidia repens TaxID=90262 RepID=A0A1X2I3I8_9FUNG|nr:hypothetical protein BCR42DRAFT_144643 [Absidia repens]
MPFSPLKKNWKDVDRNIKQMDQLYDATFYSWLKAEDNVLVTSMYLQRIANEYSLDRVINAIKWLVSDWRWESTSILVRHITVGWCDEEGDMRRAQLLRHLTQTWAAQYTATLLTAILTTSPYSTAPNAQRERFIRAFTDGWGFSKLSEFFMYLQNQTNIDYKTKCLMLQEAARRERKKLNAKLNRRRRRQCHHEEDKSTSTAQPLSPVTSITIATTPQSTNEPSSYLSVQMDNSNSGASITRHQHRHDSGLNFDEHTLERTASATQVSASSSSSRSTGTSHQSQQRHQQQQQQQQQKQQQQQQQQHQAQQTQQTHSRYHHQHHRRISSNDMLDVKRQRYTSAFNDDSTDIDYKLDDQQQHDTDPDDVNYILSSSSSSNTGSSTARNSKIVTTSTIAASPSTSRNTRGASPSLPAATTCTAQSPHAENGNLTSDLSRMGLGSAVHSGCSAGSGTTTHPSSSSSMSTAWTHHHHHHHHYHHQRRRSSTSSTSMMINNSNNDRSSGASVTDTNGGDLATPENPNPATASRLSTVGLSNGDNSIGDMNEPSDTTDSNSNDDGNSFSSSLLQQYF